MINILKKFAQHGIVTVDYPNEPLKNDFITGRPEIDNKKCNMCKQCVERCPSAAINVYGDGAGKKVSDTECRLVINLDECVFCSLCADICTRKAITMTNDFEMASIDRNDLRGNAAIIDERNIPSEDYELIGRRLEKSIKEIFGRSLHIREVDSGSCNGCDSEINALNNPYNDIERFGISFVASPRHADMLLVTGAATRNMELALIKTYNAVPDPKLVVAVGACACSGGIFRDSYSTRNGVDCVVPVDIYIPGCPPRPQAIIYGILKSIEKITKIKT